MMIGISLTSMETEQAFGFGVMLTLIAVVIFGFGYFVADKKFETKVHKAIQCMELTADASFCGNQAGIKGY